MYLALYVKVLTVVALIATVDASFVNGTEPNVKKSTAALGPAITPVVRDVSPRRPQGEERAINGVTNGEARSASVKEVGMVIAKPLGPVKPHELALGAQINHWVDADLPLGEVFKKLAYGKTNSEQYLAKGVLPFYVAYSQLTAFEKRIDGHLRSQNSYKRAFATKADKNCQQWRDDIGSDTAKKINIVLIDLYYKYNYGAEHVAKVLQEDQPTLHRVHVQAIKPRYNPEEIAGNKPNTR